MTTSPPSLRLEAVGIVVAWGGRNVLDTVSLRLRAGEIATLEGASGSGKTTLLRVLASLASPDSGALQLDGVDARVIAPRTFRTRVGYVAQHPPMVDGSVHENVAEGPRLQGRTLDASMSAALLARVGLDAFGPKTARDLSVGEKQRVALARALANAPDVLLLDEPTSALDPGARDHVLALLRALTSEGLAVLVVTHADGDAVALAGTRYRLRAGALEPFAERA